MRYRIDLARRQLIGGSVAAVATVGLPACGGSEASPEDDGIEQALRRRRRPNATTTATASPTPAPTSEPTLAPTTSPTLAPTPTPTLAPTPAPTASPTPAPTASPTSAPTAAPTPAPTAAPTAAPTPAPTPAPTSPPGPDGSAWDGGQGSAYKGHATFTALKAVHDSIGSGGGWAQLPNSTLSTAFPTSSQIDAVSPFPVLRQPQWPNNVTVWGSAAFNGYGWFYVTPGGHFAGYMNDTYILRVADPVGPVRMHMPAPIEAVSRRSDNVLIDRSTWGSMAVTNVVASTLWGPLGTHQYSGMLWHAAAQKLVLGGDAQTFVTNPGSIGSAATRAHAIYVFDPYAASPRQAWARITVPSSGTYRHGSGFLLNADGTVSFRDFGSGERFTLNVNTKTVTSGVVHNSPTVDRYQPWRHVARDPATGRTYELNRPGSSDVDAASLYDTTSGSAVKVADLPASWWTGSPYQDNQSKIEIVNGRAYVMAQTGPGSGGAIRLGVHQIDLASKAVQSFTASPAMTVPEGLYDSIAINGMHGRFAYVPQVGCFVAMPSARANVWVFRPPAAWAV